MKCKCGKTHVRKSASEAVITCTECGWHHTYKAMPKRTFDLMDMLLTLLHSYREEFGSKNDKEDADDV